MTKLKTSCVKGAYVAALVGQVGRYDAGVLRGDFERLVYAHRLVLAQDDVVDRVQRTELVRVQAGGVADDEEAEADVLEHVGRLVDEDDLKVGVELVHLHEGLDVDVVLSQAAVRRCPLVGRDG